MKCFTKILLLLIFLSHTSVSGQEKMGDTISIEPILQQLFPEAKINKIENRDHFIQNYEIILKSPLDHANPEAGSFDHYMYLSHIDKKQPTVMVTEGYNAKPRTYELSKMLSANQVQVEYRFYGKSKPDSIQWKYLKNDQAIEDYHKIRTKLASLYKGKWISTGISKGGETVLIYKSKYPKDVDVALPYVAPLIDGQEDARTEAHIKTVGTASCRQKVLEFQRLVLMQRDSILVEMDLYAEKKRMEFTIISKQEALEYAVLEFPFSFWQWGGNCSEIPLKESSAKDLFKYLNSIVGIGFYNDKTYSDLLPSYYQHMVELGYYGFDTAPVQDLLKIVFEPTNKRFAPKGVDLTLNESYIKDVRDYVENKGDKILYIYGEYDTWAACAPDPKPSLDAMKMTLKKGSHKTRIKDFSKEDKDKIYEKLEAWLGHGAVKNPL